MQQVSRDRATLQYMHSCCCHNRSCFGYMVSDLVETRSSQHKFYLHFSSHWHLSSILNVIVFTLLDASCMQLYWISVTHAFMHVCQQIDHKLKNLTWAECQSKGEESEVHSELMFVCLLFIANSSTNLYAEARRFSTTKSLYPH